MCVSEVWAVENKTRKNVLSREAKGEGETITRRFQGEPILDFLGKGKSEKFFAGELGFFESANCKWKVMHALEDGYHQRFPPPFLVETQKLFSRRLPAAAAFAGEGATLGGSRAKRQWGESIQAF